MPRGKKFTAEQIIEKLRETDVVTSHGKIVPKVARWLAVNEPRISAGSGNKEACGRTRLKNFEEENARVSRLFADAEPSTPIGAFFPSTPCQELDRDDNHQPRPRRRSNCGHSFVRPKAKL